MLRQPVIALGCLQKSESLQTLVLLLDLNMRLATFESSVFHFLLGCKALTITFIKNCLEFSVVILLIDNKCISILGNPVRNIDSLMILALNLLCPLPATLLLVGPSSQRDPGVDGFGARLVLAMPSYMASVSSWKSQDTDEDHYLSLSQA